jgi:hypothetical protein
VIESSGGSSGADALMALPDDHPHIPHRTAMSAKFFLMEHLFAVRLLAVICAVD